MNKKGCLFIILAGVLWGSSAIFVHYLSPLGFSSITLAGIRGITSAIITGIYILFSDKSLFKIDKKNILLHIASGITLFTTASTYYTCMTMTSVSTSVVLMYTAPILVLVYSVIFFKEKLTLKKIISVICILAGCGLVSGIIGGAKFNALGILFGILSGISYGLYNILTKIEMKRSINAMTVSFYNFAVMLVIAIFVSNLGSVPPLVAPQPVYSVTMLILLGLCTCFLPYVFYTFGMKRLPAGVASAMGIVEPMSATIFSVVLFGEKLNVFSSIGIVLIIGSVFVLSTCEE